MGDPQLSPAATVGLTPPIAGVLDVPLSRLRAGRSPRERGIDPAHVRVLAESADRWPPVLVTTAYEVVDGCHRVAAARALGRTRVTAEIFIGTADEAFVESVRRNVDHGLALSLSERRAAATRILDLRPAWSDRRIGVLAGLSPSTVAGLRAARGVTGDSGTTWRLGSDGRARPTDPAPLRTRIADAIADHPGASLRTIAGIVGASPETVRSVRNRLPADTTSPAAPDADETQASPDRGPRWWERDSALTSTPAGRELVTWLTQTDVGECAGPLATVPLSRVYEVSEELRRRAASWAELADTLERRASRGNT